MTFKPSQVSFHTSFPPLVDTMGKTESEAAALLMLIAMIRQGDEWKTVTPKELGAAIDAELELKSEPLTALSRNPFFRPDFQRLVKDGFARFTQEEKHNQPIEFTEQGIAALEKHVR